MVVVDSPVSVLSFSGNFGLVTITTINFFSSILYSEIALSSVRILPTIITTLTYRSKVTNIILQNKKLNGTKIAYSKHYDL